MAYNLTVAGYTFENPPEEYRKLARLSNSPQPSVGKEATDFYQSDSQDLQFQVEGTLALDPPLGETQDDLDELERLQQIAIDGGEVQVDFDPFFSGKCVIEDDPFRQSEGESDYSFTFTINSESTDDTAYPARNPPDTGNTFELGSLNLGYDPDTVSQNYERQTEKVKRLQGIAKSVDNSGLIPKVKVSGNLDGDGQATLWEKARNNVLAFLSAEFQNGWCLIGSLSIRNNPEAPDYLDGLFTYDLDVLIVKDPSSGIGDVTSYVDQEVRDLGTYAGDQDSGNSSFADLEFTVDGGSGSLDGSYIEWNQTTVTLSDNDTNYVYADDADSDGYGQVKVNQSAFPADAVPLYRVETANGQITKVVDVRAILLNDREREEGGDDGGESIAGDVYFTVFGGDYEIASGTTSDWEDTRLLLASNDRNFIWVEDNNADGTASVNTATSGYPTSGNYIEMYRVDTDADSVMNVIDDRPADLNDSSTDTSDADFNFETSFSLNDGDPDFARILALSDVLSVADTDLLPALGLASLSDTLSVQEGPFDARGQAELSETLAVNDGGSAQTSGTSETLAWDSETDWESYTDRLNMDTGGYGDIPNSDTAYVQQPNEDQFASGLQAFYALDDLTSGGTATDYTGNGYTLYGVSFGTNGGVSSGWYGTDSFYIGGDSWIRNVSSLPTDPSNDFTILAWVYISDWESGAGTDQQSLFGWADSGDSEWFTMTARHPNDGTTSDPGDWKISSNGRTPGNGGTSELNTWHLVGFTYDSSANTFEAWKNGVSQYSDTPNSTGWLSNLDDFQIGDNSEQGANPADAKIENVRIYNRVLSGSEMAQHYDMVYPNALDGSSPGSYIETATKQFSNGSKPDLQNLSYETAGNLVNLKVIGSPGTVGEEIQEVTLNGSTSYNLNWNSSHEKFRIRFEHTRNADATSEVSLSAAEIQALVRGEDPDQNPQTAWKILGASYDTPGNEYEGGGVISRYGG